MVGYNAFCANDISTQVFHKKYFICLDSTMNWFSRLCMSMRRFTFADHWNSIGYCAILQQEYRSWAKRKTTTTTTKKKPLATKTDKNRATHKAHIFIANIVIFFALKTIILFMYLLILIGFSKKKNKICCVKQFSCLWPVKNMSLFEFRRSLTM